MSLMTLGVQTVRTDALATARSVPRAAIAETKAASGGDADELARKLAEAESKLASARTSVLDRLTPWIPGDFLVIYGGLLTAWTQLRADFWSMIALAFGLAFAFVFGAAFAATGFKAPEDRPIRELGVRAVVGGFVSIAASTAIPDSGWYDIKNFRDNELSWVFTVSLLVALLTFVLLGLQKLTGIKLQNVDANS